MYHNTNMNPFFAHKKQTPSAFDVDFDESEVYSQKSQSSGTLSQKQDKVKPFTTDRKHKNGAFEVDWEDSLTPESSQEATQSLSLDKFKKPNLFKTRKGKENFFDVDFEESQETKSSQSQLSQKLSELESETSDYIKNNIFRNQKNSKSSGFNVNFEESQDLKMSQDSQPSQESKENESLRNRNSKQNIFKNQKKKKSDFNINFEESKETDLKSVQGSQSSQELNETENEPSKNLKSNIFKVQKKATRSTFSVDFEESKNSSFTLSQNSQETNETKNGSKYVKGNIFKKQKKEKNNFDVDFEESRNISMSMQKADNDNEDTGFQKNNPFKANALSEHSFNTDINNSKSNSHLVENISLDEANGETNAFKRSNPFSSAKKSKEEMFGISFEESRQMSTEDGKESSVNVNSKKNASVNQDNGTGNSNTSESNLVFRMKSDSPRMTFNKSEMNSINESIIHPILEERSLNELSSNPSFTGVHNSALLNESSFNDENLNQWMSDQSEDEKETSHNVRVTENIAKPLQENTKTVEKYVIESTEEMEKRFEMKLMEIVKNAGTKNRGITQSSVPVKPNVQKEGDQVNKLKDNNKINRIMNKNNKYNYKPPKLRKPAPYANKRFYEYLIKKLKPKYGLDATLKAEELTLSICETVKIVMRRKNHQKKIIDSLKKEMAMCGLVKTTHDFYQFVRDYLPHPFRCKVIPCIQPGTNITYPPMDAKSPFDNIL